MTESILMAVLAIICCLAMCYVIFDNTTWAKYDYEELKKEQDYLLKYYEFLKQEFNIKKNKEMDLIHKFTLLDDQNKDKEQRKLDYERFKQKFLIDEVKNEN